MKAAVYVIEADNTGLVKVGISDDPKRRLGDLRTSAATKLSLAHVEHVHDVRALDVERAAHALLRSVHSHREWFETDVATAVAAIKKAIEAIRAIPSPEPYLVQSPKAKAALSLLRDGHGSPAEVAKVFGVSRQLLNTWIKAAKIDWRANREASTQRIWDATIKKLRG